VLIIEKSVLRIVCNYLQRNLSGTPIASEVYNLNVLLYPDNRQGLRKKKNTRRQADNKEKRRYLLESLDILKHKL